MYGRDGSCVSFKASSSTFSFSPLSYSFHFLPIATVIPDRPFHSIRASKSVESYVVQDRRTADFETRQLLKSQSGCRYAEWERKSIG